MLAYVGPRPSDALGLRWRDVGERTLTFYAPKTNRVRSARLMGPVAADLALWRQLSVPPDGSGFVFPRRDGERWTTDDWRNWRSRVFFPALDAVGLERRPP